MTCMYVDILFKTVSTSLCRTVLNLNNKLIVDEEFPTLVIGQVRVEILAFPDFHS